MWVVKSHMSRGVNLGVGHYPPVRGQGPETPPPIMWFVQVTWFKVWTGISWSDKGSWCQSPPPLFNDSRSYLVSMTSFALLPNSLKEWPFSFRMHTYSWVSCRDDSPRLCSSLNCASYLVFGSCQPKWTFVTLINHMMKRALLHNALIQTFAYMILYVSRDYKVGQWLQGAIPPVGSRHQFIELKKLLKLEVKHLHGPKGSVRLHFQFLRQGCQTYSRRAGIGLYYQKFYSFSSWHGHSYYSK